jgi:hypothetical protein
VVSSLLKQEEKMSRTLNDYLVLLKPKYQEYIVHCVKEHGNRPDFHRGLLPFLPAEEAARVLRFRLEDIKAGTTIPGVPTEINPVIGEKFIRGIISVFEGALVHKLHEDERSETIRLSDAKIYKTYQKRIRDGKFCIRIGMLTNASHLDCLTELEWVSKDLWKVTAKSGLLEHISLELCDCYGLR